jgi:hypothetical protein
MAVLDRRGEMGGVGDGKVMGGIGEKSRGGAAFFACAALWWFACGFGLFLIFYRSGRVCFWLFAYGVGLSLRCYRSISFAPVRGGTYFSLPAAKKSRQKKAGSHR